MKRKKRGFTLIEIIVVIAILGILAAILIPNVIDRTQQAKQQVLETNTKGLQTYLSIFAMKYDRDHLFADSGGSDTGDPDAQTFLSRYLETYLKTSGSDTNSFVISNPYSRNMGVINNHSYQLEERYRRQAVVISDNAALKYSGSLSEADGKTYLAGAIIIYAKNGEDTMALYYIDKDGKKSKSVYYVKTADR